MKLSRDDKLFLCGFTSLLLAPLALIITLVIMEKPGSTIPEQWPIEVEFHVSPIRVTVFPEDIDKVMASETSLLHAASDAAYPEFRRRIEYLDFDVSQQIIPARTKD